MIGQSYEAISKIKVWDQNVLRNRCDCKSPRVLVLDDCATMSALSRCIFNTLGVEVDVATDAIEAIHLLEEHEYSLALVDLSMPVVDGYRASELIRKGRKNADVPLIAWTVSKLDACERKCRLSGMSGYASKHMDVGVALEIFKIIGCRIPFLGVNRSYTDKSCSI